MGDIVKAFEQGKIAAPVTRGLVRAALLKGSADLSTSAINRGIEAIGTTPAETLPTAPDGRTALVEPAEVQAPEPTNKPLPISESGLVNSFMRRNRVEPPTGVEQEVTSPAAESATDSATSAFLRKHRAEVATNLPEILPEEEAVPATVPTEDEVNAFIKQQWGDAAPTVKVVREEAPEAGASEAEQARLAMDTLARYASKNKTATYDPVQQLFEIKERLGLTKKPLSPEAMKTAGKVDPEALASIKARQGVRVEYKKTPGEGGLSNRHEVTITKADGTPGGNVVAFETRDRPGLWTVRASSNLSGVKGSGSRAMELLADKARATANDTGRVVMLQGDASQTPAAKAAWGRLGKTNKVVWDADDRPSVTFMPSKTAPKPSGPNPLAEKFPVSRPEPGGFLGRAQEAVQKRTAPKPVDLTEELNRHTGDWRDAIE